MTQDIKQIRNIIRNVNYYMKRNSHAYKSHAKKQQSLIDNDIA